jgi:HEAT repeat protein
VSHPVVAGLRSADVDERLAACRRAAEDPAGVLFVDALVQALADPVRAVFHAASDALASLGRQHEVTPALRAALRTGPGRARAAAALTLARLEPPDLRLLPALVAGLGLDDAKLRWSSLKTLVETGRLHGEVLPLLAGLARQDPSPVVRRMAHHGLRELGRDDPAAALALLEGTRDEDVAARRAAYAALSTQLEPPRPVLEQLTAALSQEPDAACRRIASVALGEIGSRDGLDAAAHEALRRARDEAEDPDLRRGADRALRRSARRARSAPARAAGTRSRSRRD